MQMHVVSQRASCCSTFEACARPRQLYTGYNHVFMLNLNLNHVKSGMETIRMIPELEGSSMSVSCVGFLTSLIALLGLHQHMHITKQLTDQQINRSIDLRGMLRFIFTTTLILKHKLCSSGIECLSEAELRRTAEHSIAMGNSRFMQSNYLSGVSVAVNDPSSVLGLP